MTIRKQYIPKANKWSHLDRLRLVYLCVIAGLLMTKNEKVSISHDYIKLVMDFEQLRAYPWGLHAFDHLVSSIIDTRKKLSRQTSYVLEGFSYAFQIWIMEAIPNIGTLLGTKLNEVAIVTPRCSNWRGAGVADSTREVDVSTLDLVSTEKVEFLLIISPFGAWENYVDVMEVRKQNGEEASWWSICKMSERGCILVRPDQHIAWRAKSGVTLDPTLHMRNVFSIMLGKQ